MFSDKNETTHYLRPEKVIFHEKLGVSGTLKRCHQTTK